MIKTKEELYNCKVYAKGRSREDIQTECKATITTSLNRVGKAAIIASVGLGKSKIVLDILAQYNPSKITWVTSNELLRDVDTPLEFAKWGYDYLLDRTDILCVQSAYKLVGQDLGFLVVDEADAAISEEYVKCITNNTFSKLLLVTGTTNDGKREVLSDLGIPIVYEISNQTAQDLGVLNKIRFQFLEFNLSTKKDYEVVTKYKRYFTSENAEYERLDKAYMSELIPFLGFKKILDDHFQGGEPFPEGHSYSSIKATKDRHKKKMEWINSQRYRFLQNLNTSADLTKNILMQHYYANEVDKMIVFCGSIEQAERVCKYTYHSKNKNGNTSIEDFNEGRLRVLGVCSALDRGKNMVGLNVGIFNGYDSSSTKTGQRLGRLCRLMADQEATVYFLVPFYMKKVVNKETREVTLRRTPTRASAWLESALSNYRIDSFNSEVRMV